MAKSYRNKSVIKAKAERQKEKLYELTKNLKEPVMEEVQMERPRSSINRVYKGEVEFDHDLFKLEVGMMKKNISIADDNPLYVGVEHCHFYHTYDSSGRKQEACAPIAGHTHEVEIFTDSSGNLMAKVGPASIRKGGKYIPLKGDNHTHEAKYLRSERVKVRKVNAEATKAYDATMSKMMAND